jgi:signal transduction histidine kinase
VRLVVFRSIRELLNNVVKHAQATLVTVSIARENDRMVILVEDNGMGCDPNAGQVKGGGFGLLSIREALEHLGGTLNLSSRPGRGCRAILSAPLMLEHDA